MRGNLLSITKPALLLAALAVIGLGTPTLSDAAKVRKKVSLNPTARTLGGPGVAHVKSGDSVDVLKIAVDGEEERFLCATAHNFGPGNASLRIVGNAPASKQIKPSQTRSLCSQGTVVSLTCEEGPCDTIWRVDNGD